MGPYQVIGFRPQTFSIIQDCIENTISLSLVTQILLTRGEKKERGEPVSNKKHKPS